MTRSAAVLVLTALFTIIWVKPASGHDIGVSQAVLEALDGGRYVLGVQTGDAQAHRFGPPALPARCVRDGPPRGAQDHDWRRYAFSCEPSLTAADTLELPWRRDGIMLIARWADGGQARRLFSNEAGRIRVPLGELRAGSGSWLDGARRYTALGIEHILTGIDHLLFVLALLLIVGNRWMLVKTITAFTVAHSITLGLAVLGVIEVPAKPVEAAIALSVVFLCVEIVHAQRGRLGLAARSPWVVAFAFGLLHGLGFAGALSAIGLPASEVPLALAFFNIGVELGQLAFVVVAIGVFTVLRRTMPGPRQPALARLASAYAVGTISAFWLLERIAVMLPGA